MELFFLADVKDQLEHVVSRGRLMHVLHSIIIAFNSIYEFFSFLLRIQPLHKYCHYILAQGSRLKVKGSAGYLCDIFSESGSGAVAPEQGSFGK